MQRAFKVGDSILLPQDFNATCARIESLEGVGRVRFAICVDAHDIFGKVPHERVRIPLATARSWKGAPRRVSLAEAFE